MADINNAFATHNASFRSKYTYEMSKYYTDKMMQLIDEKSKKDVYPLDFGDGRKLKIPFSLEGYVPDGRGGTRVYLPIILMHRIGTLVSEDGHRLYEFLIEYDTESPSVGIYFGCRGVTVDGFNHDEEILRFCDDAEAVSTEIKRVLNNMFVDIDFSNRFKYTDNANDGTYWLFWLSLNEEEDIKTVGVNATEVIYNVFERYLKGEVFSNAPLNKKKSQKVSMCFTDETYQALLKQMDYYEVTDADLKKTKMIEEKSKRAKETFELFLTILQQKRIIVKDSSYEHAYRVLSEIDKEEYSAAGFVRMIYAFLYYLCTKDLFTQKANKNKENKYKYSICVPWTALCDVFLDKDGNAFNAMQLKTQLNAIKKDKKSADFEKEFEKLSGIISDWFES